MIMMVSNNAKMITGMIIMVMMMLGKVAKKEEEGATEAAKAK